MLGMNLKKQKILMDHFLKNLEKEVATAKRAGTYDIGIKTVTGHSVSIEKPRAFTFRGLEAKGTYFDSVCCMCCASFMH
jgi:hypothetical protein